MPGERSFFLITYGCTLNTSDSQLIRGTMQRDGWTSVDAIEKASVIIVNTCSVKVPTEQKIMHRLASIASTNPRTPLIIAGCLPAIYKSDPGRFKAIAPSAGAVVGPRNYHEMATVAARVEAGERGIERLDGQGLHEKASLVPARDANHVAIVPIAEGCLGSCTYCCTRFARGSLQSYPSRVVIQSYKDNLAAGVMETWLTAEDCAAYKDPDNDRDLAGLLDTLSAIEGPHVMRVGMMNPKTLLPILPRLVKVVSERPRIFEFIHVPVQSGSDTVLRAMNRGYTREDFLLIVETFRAKVPDVTIATDVICGFPGETNDDHQHTVSLVEQVKPDILNISAYGHRPGTAASRLPALPSNVVKERTRDLAARHDAITVASSRSWVDWEGPAIISEYNAARGTWVARTRQYKPVVLDGHGAPGTWIQVKVTGACRHYLTGTITGPARLP